MREIVLEFSISGGGGVGLEEKPLCIFHPMVHIHSISFYFIIGHYRLRRDKLKLRLYDADAARAKWPRKIHLGCGVRGKITR